MGPGIGQTGPGDKAALDVVNRVRFTPDGMESCRAGRTVRSTVGARLATRANFEAIIRGYRAGSPARRAAICLPRTPITVSAGGSRRRRDRKPTEMAIRSGKRHHVFERRKAGRFRLRRPHNSHLGHKRRRPTEDAFDSPDWTTAWRSAPIRDSWPAVAEMGLCGYGTQHPAA